MKTKFIIFNFGISDEFQALVICNNKIIKEIKDRGKKFKYYLNLLEEYKNDSYCYLPKDAYLESFSGDSCFDVLINSGFKVA